MDNITNKETENITIMDFLAKERESYFEVKSKVNLLEFKMDILESILALKGTTNVQNFFDVEDLLKFVYPPVVASQIISGFANYASGINLYNSKILNNPNSSKNDIREEAISELVTKQNNLFYKIESDLIDISVEYYQLLAYIKENSKRLYRNKLVYHSLTNKLPISFKLEKAIYDQLIDSDMEKANIIFIMDQLRDHRFSIFDPGAVKYDYAYKMMIEEIEPLEITRDEELKYLEADRQIIESYYKSLNITDNFEVLLDSIDSNFPTLDELLYIYKNLINALIDDINDTKDLLVESYMDLNDRKSAILLNKEEKKKLSLLFDRYYLLINTKEDEIVNDENITEEEIDSNVLLFLERGAVGQGTYVENDLKSIPKEKYEETKFLLTHFKKGDLQGKYIRQLANNSTFKGFKEIKGDQVRILFKHLQANEYLMLGVGLKKDDVDLAMYESITGRYSKDADYSYLRVDKDQAFKRITEYIAEHSRKGSR